MHKLTEDQKRVLHSKILKFDNKQMNILNLNIKNDLIDNRRCKKCGEKYLKKYQLPALIRHLFNCWQYKYWLRESCSKYNKELT